ncbi:putative holin-like toxin [Brevibacillus sp. LEMMJ03]|uniref:putative holin-like toxin n=1 Tax=Brevibacillus sp. LEMMJ03 TaxID=2595056 RepID=UPI00351B50AF
MVSFTCTIGSAPKGGRLTLYPTREGGENVTVYEAISLMLTFGLLIVAVLSFHKKK